jgi:hypothetical protein
MSKCIVFCFLMHTLSNSNILIDSVNNEQYIFLFTLSLFLFHFISFSESLGDNYQICLNFSMVMWMILRLYLKIVILNLQIAYAAHLVLQTGLYLSIIILLWILF